MDDKIKEVKELLEATDLYDAAKRICDLVGEDLFIRASNGDPEALREVGSKLVEKAKDLESGPKKIKDKQFLKNLNRLLDR